MKEVNNYFMGILVVCLVSGVFLFLSMMALQDIYLGKDPDLTSEWNIIRINYVVNGLLFLFIVLTFLRFRKTLKRSH